MLNIRVISLPMKNFKSTNMLNYSRTDTVLKIGRMCVWMGTLTFYVFVPDCSRSIYSNILFVCLLFLFIPLTYRVSGLSNWL